MPAPMVTTPVAQPLPLGVPVPQEVPTRKLSIQ
jgi:hypothetical protein